MADNPLDNNGYSQYTINPSAQWTPRQVPQLPLTPGWSQPVNFQQLMNTPLSAYGAVGNTPGSFMRPTPDPRFGGGGMFGNAVGQNAPVNNAMGWENELRRWMRDTVETLHSISNTDKRLLYLSENPLGIPPRPTGGPRPGAGNSFNDVINHAMALREEELRAAAHTAAGGGGGGFIPPGRGGVAAGAAGGGGGGNWARGFHGIGSMMGFGVGRFTYGAGELGGAIGGPRGATIGAGIGLGADLLVKSAQLPLDIGRFAYGLYGESQPYTDLQVQLANATRAAGGDFRAMSQGWIPQWGQPSAGWGALGITPQRALESLSRIGGQRIGMTDPMANDFILRARELRLSSAYSMLPEGSVEALGSQGMRFGIGGAQNPLAMAEQFAGVLETAFARGADRSEVFRQIQQSTEVMGRSSIYAPNTEGMAALMQRMFMVDMPGARSGNMQQQLLTGTNAALNDPFSNPMRAYLVDMVRRGTNFNDPNAVSALLGPGMANSEYGRNVLGMLQGNNTSPAFLDKALAGAMQGNLPAFLGRIAQMQNPYGTGATANVLWTQTVAGALGVSPETVGGYFEAQRSGREFGMRRTGADSLPTDIFRYESEAVSDLMRGMRSNFEVFSNVMPILNTGLGSLANNANAAALALAKIAGNPDTGIGPTTLGTYGPPMAAGYLAGGPLGGMLLGGAARLLNGRIDADKIRNRAAAQDPNDWSGWGIGTFWNRIIKPVFHGMNPIGSAHAAPMPGVPRGASTGSDPRGMEATIRAAAIANGLNPDDVVAVARAEGLGVKGWGNWDVNGMSYGAMQMHVGGLATEYQRATGHDPADPKNEAELDAWGIAYAAKHGWGAWSSVKGGRVPTPRPLTPGSNLHMVNYSPNKPSSSVSDYFHNLGAFPDTPEFGHSLLFGTPASQPDSVSRSGHPTELHLAMEHLAGVVREVTSHLNELGHGARNAHSGLGKVGSAGPNHSISTVSAPGHMGRAYPVLLFGLIAASTFFC